MRHITRLALTALLVVQTPVWASVFEPREFRDSAQEQRYRELIAELRCLQCQNQSLADSNAPLAADLRREVYRMLDEGKSDDAIVEFLVARYGDFVLYRPPVQSNTLVLWIAPFVAGAAGVLFLLMLIRRRQASTGPADAAPVSDAERKRLSKALDDLDQRDTDR